MFFFVCVGVFSMTIWYLIDIITHKFLLKLNGRSWKQILYVIMHTLIISSCIAAFLYIKHKKIPLDRYQYTPRWFILGLYINTACAAVAIPRYRDPDSDSDSDSCDECISHGFGLALVVFLLYIISPRLALCVGIPAAVYFIAAIVCVCRLPPDDWQSNQSSRLPL